MAVTGLKRASEPFRALRISRVSPFNLRFAFCQRGGFKIEQRVRCIAFTDGPEPYPQPYPIHIARGQNRYSSVPATCLTANQIGFASSFCIAFTIC